MHVWEEGCFFFPNGTIFGPGFCFEVHLTDSKFEVVELKSAAESKRLSVRVVDGRAACDVEVVSEEDGANVMLRLFLERIKQASVSSLCHFLNNGRCVVRRDK
jgi:hypothetical protein